MNFADSFCAILSLIRTQFLEANLVLNHRHEACNISGRSGNKTEFSFETGAAFSMNGTKIYGELTPCGGGDPIPMLSRKLIVGRRNSCDVTLRFPNVSSHHCELELINGYWHVKDLGSSNGIRVNSERCDQKWVFPGDILHVGRHKFEVAYEAAGERPVDDENPFARSLLEKAGLAGKRRHTPEPELEPEPAPEPPKPPRQRTDPTDDDLAMEWLKDR